MRLRGLPFPLMALSRWRSDARRVGVIRVGFGVAALLLAFEELPVLLRLADSGVLRVPYVAGLHVPPAVFFALAVALPLTSLAFGVGAFTPLTGWLLVATQAGTLLVDQQTYSNHLYLATLVAVLLTLGEAGSAVSVDARWRHRGQPSVPAWPLALMAVQVSVVYAFAALSKVNASYLSGSVISSYLRSDGLLAVPASWHGFQPMFVLSALGILTEAFLAIALWLPRWRPTAFLAGLGLHAAITVWLTPTSQLFTFSLLMLPLYLSFLDVGASEWSVVWDDSCSFCASAVRWARRLDWLGVLRFVPASDAPAREALGVSEVQAMAAVQLVQSGEPGVAGFDAVAVAAQIFPLTFLWSIVLRFPPIARAGRLAYRRVAARRSCRIQPAPATAKTSRSARAIE